MVPSLSKIQIKALKELEKRNKLKNVDLLKDSFPEQTAFIKDPSKRKAALTNRRAGKTTAVGILLFYWCLLASNTFCLYVGLTQLSAKNVIVPVLKKLNRRFNINARFYSSPARVEFNNGSVIHFFGMNDNETEREKLLGQHYKLAVIDECASYTIDLKAAIKEFISPTLIDDDGQLVLVGTPGNNRNYFCEITDPDLPDHKRIKGWSCHYWLANQNPHVAKNFEAEVAQLKTDYPNIEEDPGFQQHYLGKWTIDNDKKAYKATSANYIQELPPGNYNYGLGMDIGWEDENSFIIEAWKENDPVCYFVESFSKNKMLLDEMIVKIEEMEKKYPISKYVIDSANKQYVEELKYRSKRPFEPAIKTEKMNYVNMMNSDFILQKIKIVEPDCQSLINEYDTLTINNSNPVKPFIVGGDHNADAALYIWRKSYHYTQSIQPNLPPISEEDKIDQFWEEEAEKINNRNFNSFLDD